MHMDTGEILRMYRTAKDKSAQVKILAEFNACSKDEILSILKLNGITQWQLPRGPRKDKGTKRPKVKKNKITRKEEKSMENNEGFIKITPESVIDDGLNTEENALTVQIARVQRENEDLVAKIDVLEKELQNLRKDYGATVMRNKENDEIITKTMEVKKKMEKEIADLTEVNNKLIKENKELEEEYTRLAKQFDAQVVEISAYEKEIAELRDSSENSDICRKENCELYHEIEVRDDYIVKLEKAIVSRFLKES